LNYNKYFALDTNLLKLYSYLMKKPWAGRFKDKTARVVEAFTESVSFDRRMWRYDIQGSIAHARMLGKQGIISRTEDRRIVKALNDIAVEIGNGKFKFSEKLEDIHMNIEAALMKKIGPLGGKLHTARSRNDQVSLDLRLYLRAEADEIVTLVKRLQVVFLEVAEKHAAVIMPGYTHMQRAQPVLLAHHLLGYVEMLQRDRERLTECRKRINVLPLGACALAGTSLPIDRKYVAKLLGFDSVAKNSMDAVSDRDFCIEFVSASSILMMHLSRFSEELVLWASDEFSFIELPDAFATGSSIMPQKKNPDVPELVRGKTGRVFGNLMGLLTIMKGLPLSYNRDLQEDKLPVFDTVDTVTACLGILGDMIPRVRFNEKRMLEAASEGYSTATDMAEYLVRKGLPFRSAHEITGKVVAFSIGRGKLLSGLTLRELKKFSKLFDADVISCLIPSKSVNSRSSMGGTSSSQVRGQIRRLKTLVNN
jgi:argininosuccinate lyase